MTARYEIRPLGRWDRPETAERRSSATFRATWDDTLKLLLFEVEQVGGYLVVLQIDADTTDIRRDGMLRARASVNFPGVKVSFESTFGPLTYATDTYDQWYSGSMPGWRANVRAVALGLQALRAVDRYGITHTGEQYRGFTAISAKPVEDDLTVEDAIRVIADGAGARREFVRRFASVLVDAASRQPFVDERSVIESREAIKRLYHSAAHVHHPDKPKGSESVMRLLNRARDVLLAGGAK